eukprot:gnl/TRDRNA2_/TRDRNA2_169645_c0_seq5.p1 gnl/TRDRNA2_/TRDRNA2_169645_c0~~gnl/TRDRNA2_/TRDRNA2_169645_c0_seq5.p1  ORF type:complete len:215 (-),score=47.36 gnl/TRDRNA2_/TRDRNA2_169645_c0_seq5:299-943(-)
MHGLHMPFRPAEKATSLSLGRLLPVLVGALFIGQFLCNIFFARHLHSDYADDSCEAGSPGAASPYCAEVALFRNWQKDVDEIAEDSLENLVASDVSDIAGIVDPTSKSYIALAAGKQVARTTVSPTAEHEAHPLITALVWNATAGLLDEAAADAKATLIVAKTTTRGASSLGTVASSTSAISNASEPEALANKFGEAEELLPEAKEQLEQLEQH